MQVTVVWPATLYAVCDIQSSMFAPSAACSHHSIYLPFLTWCASHTQEDAVAATRQRLEQELPADARPKLHLVCTCHSRLQEVAGSGRAKVVAFNCGYLPRGDKAIFTSTATTLTAIEAALEVSYDGIRERVL